MKIEITAPVAVQSRPTPTVAVALGGGGARGLGHIVVLEALDELGVRPVAVAGTSIGAIIGAAYAAGLTGKEIREEVRSSLRNRSRIMANLLRARVGKFSELLLRRSGNPVMLDPQRCLELFWQGDIPARFEDLQLPLLVVTTDFHACCEVVCSQGPLAPAIAASMAIPGLFRAVDLDGRVLIDGGAVNPLPYDLLFDHADAVVAVDVTFGGRIRERRHPSPFPAMIGAAQIMQGSITAQKIRSRPPDLLLRPSVEQFNVLHFTRAAQILHAADASKDDIKRQLAVRLECLPAV